MISNMVLDGLEAVIHGSSWHRQVHNINYIRWADDFIITANSREVLEHSVRPRIEAFLADRGVQLSATKTLLTPLTAGFDFLGQTIRKFARPQGKPAKLQITPSKASFQAVKAKVKALCHHARTPTELIETLTPCPTRVGELSSPCDLWEHVRPPRLFRLAPDLSMGQAAACEQDGSLDHSALLPSSTG